MLPLKSVVSSIEIFNKTTYSCKLPNSKRKTIVNNLLDLAKRTAAAAAAEVAAAAAADCATQTVWHDQDVEVHLMVVVIFCCPTVSASRLATVPAIYYCV